MLTIREICSLVEGDLVRSINALWNGMPEVFPLKVLPPSVVVENVIDPHGFPMLQVCVSQSAVSSKNQDVLVSASMTRRVLVGDDDS